VAVDDALDLRFQPVSQLLRPRAKPAKTLNPNAWNSWCKEREKEREMDVLQAGSASGLFAPLWHEESSLQLSSLL
jgi:hypothetical protein